jgi:hypothetical protein
MRRRILEILIEVLAEELEDQDHVRPERERIDDSHDACLIRWVMLLDGSQYPVLNLSVIKVELLVPTNLNGNLSAGILDVKALDDLAKGPFVDNLGHKVSVSDMLPDSGAIVTFGISAFCDTLPSIAANCIDIFEVVQF